MAPISPRKKGASRMAWGGSPWARHAFHHRVATSDAVSAISINQGRTANHDTIVPDGALAMSSPRKRPPKLWATPSGRLVRRTSSEALHMVVREFRAVGLRRLWSTLHNRLAFDPNSIGLARWHTCLLAFLLYDALAIPMLVCFRAAAPTICATAGVVPLLNLFELAFLGDVYIQFHTGFFRNGDLVRDAKATRHRYLWSLQFPLDMLALVPLSWLPLSDDETLCGVFHANKLVRLRRLHQYTIAFDKVFARYFQFCKVAKVVAVLVCFCHVMACIYILFGFAHAANQGSGDDSHAETWQLEAALAHEHLPVQYLASLVWVLGIVSRVVEGDTPRTLLETLFMNCVMLGGFLLFVYICGTLFMISKCDSNSRELFDAKLNQLRYVLSFHRVPQDIQARAVEFLEALARPHNGFKSGDKHDRNSLRLLCPSLAKDVKFTLLKPIVTSVPFFSVCHVAFIRAVIDLMEMQALPTNCFVCHQGDHGEDMYFVQSGVLAVLIKSVKVRELRRGAFFGELSLFSNQVRTASVATATFCLLLRLSRVHICRVMDAYPDLEAPILDCVDKISKDLDAKAKDPADELARRSSLQYSDAPPSMHRLPTRVSVVKSVNLLQPKTTESSQLNDAASSMDHKTLAAMASALHEKVKPPWWSHLLLAKALDRRASYRSLWLRAVLMTTVYNIIVVPLVCSFSLVRYSTTILALNTVADVVLYADMYGKLNLSYDEDAEQITETRKCAANYLRTTCAFDVVCAFPYWIINPSAQTLLRLPRLLRCLSLQGDFDELMLFVHATSRHRIGVLGVTLFLCYHIAGCLAHSYSHVAGYGNDPHGWLPPTTLELTAVTDPTTGDVTGYAWPNGTVLPPSSPQVAAISTLQYMRALQYGAVCITNLGLPLMPETLWEYLLSFAFMLSGMLLVSSIIDEVQKRVTVSAIEQMEFLSTRSRILHFLRRQKAPTDLHRRVLAFLDFSWSVHRGADINLLLSELPITMQRDIYGYICAPAVEMMARMDHETFDRLSHEFLDNVTIQLFGQDELIYRVGDIATSFYVLLEGDVSTYVTVRGYSHMHNLKQGQMFGFASLDISVDHAAQVDNAVARSACVVAVVTRDTIQSLNEIHPHFSDEVRDRSRRLDRQMTSHHVIQKLLRPQRVINPDSRAAVLWETLLFFGITYECVMVPYYMAFGFARSTVAAADGVSIVLEACFLLDIFLKMRTGYVHYGNKVMDIKSIRKRYLWSTTFFIDVLAVAPTNLINAFLSTPRTEAYNMNKLLRLFKLSSQLAHLERQYFSINIHIRVAKLVFYMGFLAHFIGCTWFNFASDQSTLLGVIHAEQFGDDDWLPSGDMAFTNPNMTRVMRFTKSFYWGLGMLLGFQPGRHPSTVIEYAFTITVQTLGVFLLAYVVGNLLDIVQVMDGNSRAFYSNLNYVRKLLQYFSFSDDVADKIKYFYFYRLFHSIHEEDMLVKCLPPSLVADIRVFLLTPMLNKVPFLEDEIAGATVIRILVSQMSQLLVTRGEIMCRQNEVGAEMYFVFAGCLEVYVLTASKKKRADSLGIKVNEICEGSFFGERALFSNQPRNATIQAKTFCTLYKLSLAHLHSVFAWRPEWKAKVLTIVKNIYKEQAALLQVATRNDRTISTATRIEKQLSSSSSDTTFPLVTANSTSAVIPLKPLNTLGATDGGDTSDVVSASHRRLSISDSVRDLAHRFRDETLPWWHAWAENVLHPHVQSPLYRSYLSLLSASLLYIALSVPYMLTFGHDGLVDGAFAVVMCLNVATDLVFVYDIWFKRHLVESAETREFYERNDVQSPSLVLDVLAVLPLDYLFGAFTHWSALLRFNRFVKLLQWNHAIGEVHRFSMSYELNRLKLLALYYCVVCYWTACAYFGLTFVDGFGDSWHAFLPTADFAVRRPVSLTGEAFEVALHRLARCLYFSATMYTGAGIVYEPHTMLQYIFLVVMAIFGVFVMGYVIGEGSTLSIYLIQNEVDFKINQMNVMAFLTRKRLPESLTARAQGYMSYWWTTHRGVAFQSILDQLPPRIRSQAALQIARLSLSRFTMRYLRPMAKDVATHDAIIHSIAERVIFEGATPYRALARHRHATGYPKGESVIVQGNIGQIVYFVSKGELMSTSTLPKFNPTRYSEGQYFGDEGVLGANVCHFSVVTTRACDLLSLTAADLVAALNSHPRFAEGLRVARDSAENVTYKLMCIEDAGEDVVRQTIEEQADTLKHFEPMASDACGAMFGQFLKLFVSSHAIKSMTRVLPAPRHSRRSQVSCQSCFRRLATLRCTPCAKSYCNPCSLKVHAAKELEDHADGITTAEIMSRPSTLFSEPPDDD
ncbi:Aste57867_22660 [Aphanomyces stellatus]|uniref:Aste57867_22660 protein n=1 Tax=Aphanomyces stellatus TaxID=120398 RepID=A0A485LLF2_9STRA|nr:hypothetical protein As57867_022590 [Aphanomyces stellatus]VFT99314.1 Aste57867_22660 [Aphanomyces stellatus]